jgi:polysaccharide chain length determinant protein (PEP-CTERM system associated)
MNGLYDEIKLAVHNVWKRRWLALLVAWGVCILGWLIVSFIPNRYESEAKIFVQMQSLLPDVVGVRPEERQREVENVKRTLTSTVNLEKVVRGTALGKNLNTPAEVTAAALGLKDKIKIVDEKENLFKISATASLGGLSDRENAKLARDMVQSLIDNFIEANLTGNRVETTQATQFLDQQITAQEQLLKTAETARVAFETKYMGLLPGVGSSASRRESARVELNQVESNLISAQSSLSAFSGQLGGISPTISVAPTFQAGGGPATARAAGLEGQVAEAYARGWTENHPDMSSLKKQLASAQAAAARESAGRMVGGSSSPNPAYTSLRSMMAEKQAAVAALSSRRAQLAAELAQFNARQIEEPTIAAEQARLTTEFSGVKAKYDKLVADREGLRLRGQMQTTTGAVKFNVTDRPTLPSKPAAPDRPTLMTGILLVGLLSGLGVAFVMGQLQPGFASAKRLGTVSGMPVIGAISEVFTEKQRFASAKKQKVFLGGAAALGAVFVLMIAVDLFQRSGVA